MLGVMEKVEKLYVIRIEKMSSEQETVKAGGEMSTYPQRIEGQSRAIRKTKKYMPLVPESEMLPKTLKNKGSGHNTDMCNK